MSVQEDEDYSESDDLRVRVDGVFSMPAAEGESQDQLLLTIDDMKKRLDTVCGAPVRIEHGGEVVGSVERVEIDAKNRIAGTVRLNPDTNGHRAARLCREGKYKGFSLGIMHEPDLSEDGRPIIKDKLILHVALAADPEFKEHTKITRVDEERQDVKIAKRFLRFAEAQARLRVGQQRKKQKSPATVNERRDPETTHPSAKNSKSKPGVVTFSSNSSVAETSTMSDLSELDRQMAELKKQREELAAKQQQQQQQEEEAAAARGGMDQDGKWTQRPPNPYTSPVVFNMYTGNHGSGHGQQHQQHQQQQQQDSPLLNMSKAASEEYDRQKADAERYEREKRASKANVPKKRTRDEMEEDNQPPVKHTEAASIVPSSDLEKRIARMQAEIEELRGKTRRTQEDNTNPSEETPSSKTQQMVDSIQSKLAKSGSTEREQGESASGMDEDEDEDIEDKRLARERDEQEIDGSKISREQIFAENDKLVKERRSLNELKTKVKSMKPGTAKQNEQDKLNAKERQYYKNCKEFAKRNTAWILHQFAEANEELDDDSLSALASHNVKTSGFNIGDLNAFKLMGNAVTVSHANAKNTLMASELQFQKDKKQFELERLQLQQKAKRAQMEADRANAKSAIMQVDPRAPSRSNAPPQKQLSRKKTSAPATHSAPLDARSVYMKQTGLPFKLVDSRSPVPRNVQIFESAAPASNIDRLKKKSGFNLYAPRKRMGMHSQSDPETERFLRELDNHRRSQTPGHQDRVTDQNFSAGFSPSAPYNSEPVDSKYGVVRMQLQ